MYVSEQLLYHYYYYLSIKSTQNGVPCNLTILIYMNDSSAQYAICICSSYLLFFSFFHPSALVPTHKQIRVSGAHKHTTYIHTHTHRKESNVSRCLCVCVRAIFIVQTSSSTTFVLLLVSKAQLLCFFRRVIVYYIAHTQLLILLCIKKHKNIN